MRFRGIKSFRGGIEDIVTWASGELSTTLRDLFAGLGRLSFADNFESFEVEVTVPAGEEVEIRNAMRVRIPTKWIVVRAMTPFGELTDGETQWNEGYVYLKNHGGSEIRARILFLA